jgi:uncharacterized protein YneF (UPF0154 family)
MEKTMNIKTKVTLLILIVLIIGVFIGVALNRIILQHRIKEAFSRINPSRIPTFYERILAPDKDHSEQISTILSKHAKRIRNIREDYIEQMKRANHSLYNELAPYLTPVQRKRFNQELFRPRRPFQRPHRFGDDFPLMKALEKDGEFLKKELSLTEEQTVKVQKILREFKVPLWIPRIRKVNAKDKIYLNVLQRAKDRDKAVKKVLNQKQKKLYDKLRKLIN